MCLIYIAFEQKRKRGVFEGGEGKEITTIEYRKYIKPKRKRGCSRAERERRYSFE